MMDRILVLLVTLMLGASVGYAQSAIKIGVAGPITGPYAQFGAQLVEGATLAIEMINADGGIKGRQIEIILGDDQCEPKQARAVANDLVNDGVVAVIGHFCSSSTIPASEVYSEADVLQITPASTNPMVTERGIETIFRVCGRDDQQGAVAGNFIVNNLGASKVAVIHDKDTYGQGLADATRDTINSMGLKEVLYEGITRGEKDFSSLVTKLKGLDVDVVYFGGLHSEAGLLVRQMRDQGLGAAFISGDGIVSDEFANIAGSGTDGVMMTFGADPRNISSAKSVVETFRERGYEPEAYTLYSFTAAQIIVEALQNTSNWSGTSLAEYLHTHEFETVMGPKAFDSKGDLEVTDYVVYSWYDDGGAFTYKEL